MVTVIIIIAIFYLVWLLLPFVRRMLMRYFARRMQNYFFSKMGMGPQPGQNRQRPPEPQPEPKPRRRKGKPYHPPRPDGTKAIPTEYAEDVEFVEIKDISQTTHIKTENADITIEEQVTDVKYVEIKNPDER